MKGAHNITVDRLKKTMARMHATGEFQPSLHFTNDSGSIHYTFKACFNKEPYCIDVGLPDERVWNIGLKYNLLGDNLDCDVAKILKQGYRRYNLLSQNPGSEEEEVASQLTEGMITICERGVWARTSEQHKIDSLDRMVLELKKAFSRDICRCKRHFIPKEGEICPLCYLLHDAEDETMECSICRESTVPHGEMEACSVCNKEMCVTCFDKLVACPFCRATNFKE